MNFLIIFGLLFLSQITVASQLDQENKTSLIMTKHLIPCPDKPNCINTEFPDKTAHYVPPLSYPPQYSAQVMKWVKTGIEAMGGTIIVEKKNYISATFTSLVFRFVDDFEIRNDHQQQTLHIRSASRTGYSDFGVNKRRVEKFSALFSQQLKSHDGKLQDE